MDNQLTICEYQSPIGHLVLGGEGETLFFIEHGRIDEKKEWIDQWAKKYHPEANVVVDPEALSSIKSELDDYFFNHKPSFSAQLTLHGTPFQKKVWETLQAIPYGQTTTYKAIAHKINHPKAVRAVGGAINKNPISIIVPCHRVIGTNKKLTGYRGGLDRKEKLLDHEKATQSIS